ncbi:MAG: TlyA family RNA methyltransferase [Firmicutes bacterium]|nr:TlyA family RNA methyltransferase [Bacillota bacterium]
MTKDRTRLDVWLVTNGLASTRSRAQALILAGHVRVNGHVETKSGRLLAHTDQVAVADSLRYVSRGGVKLERALEVFAIQPRGWEVVDVGASTGGFTDCWLQHGVERVYAVDVGYGQLDWRLRQDPRVVVMERTNGRQLSLEVLRRSQALDGASVDASFISVRLLLAPLAACLKAGGTVVALIKPQFEAGPQWVGKHGVVRDPAVHRAVLSRVVNDAQKLGYAPQGLTWSPIKGPKGNIEFLLYLVRRAGENEIPFNVDDVVSQAWQMGDRDA